MKNLRRLALIGGIALSAVAFSPKAQAQPAIVDFNGTVAPTCNVDETTNGTLQQFSPDFLTTDGDNRGSIILTCNGGTTFTISSIADNNSTISNGTYNADVDEVFVDISDEANFPVIFARVSPSLGFSENVGEASPLQPGPLNAKKYWVSMSLIDFQDFKPGTYRVRVSVDLTPQ